MTASSQKVTIQREDSQLSEHWMNVSWFLFGCCDGAGHIIARYKNMSVIADIYGDGRRPGLFGHPVSD
jgi:hypothetical protein